jgi:Spy/CpxP family protein refolding chaperone
MTRAIVWIVPVALVLSLAAPAFAQAKSAAGQRAQIAQRLERIRGEILRKRVGLDEQKARAVERILDSHETERRRLGRAARTQRRALAALLKQDSNDQAAYARAIQGLRGAEIQQQALKQREFSQIARLITPKQQAKLLIALRQMQTRLRQAARQYRQNHAGAAK